MNIKDFLDSDDFAEKLKLELEKKDKKFVYLNKTPVINYSLSEFTEDEDCKNFRKFLTSTNSVISELGEFENPNPTIPNITIGSTVGHYTLLKLQNPETDKIFLNSWQEEFTKNLITGYRMRLNQIIALWMLGGGDYFGGSIKLERPDGVHSIGKNKDSIKAQLEMMKRVYNSEFDTLTISSTLAFKLFNTDKINESKKFVKSEYGLKLEIDDASYFERATNDVIERRYIPNNVLLLSRQIKEADCYLANFEVESFIPDPETCTSMVSSTSDSPIMYFTLDNESSPTSIIGFIKGKSIPVLKNKTAFSTLTFKDII